MKKKTKPVFIKNIINDIEYIYIKSEKDESYQFYSIKELKKNIKNND
jgi:hypothetical protein